MCFLCSLNLIGLPTAENQSNPRKPRFYVKCFAKKIRLGVDWNWWGVVINSKHFDSRYIGHSFVCFHMVLLKTLICNILICVCWGNSPVAVFQKCPGKCLYYGVGKTPLKYPWQISIFQMSMYFWVTLRILL